MNKEIKHALEIAELRLQKSAACLDLLKTDPSHIGLARAEAAAARFDKMIRDKELAFQRGFVRPPVVRTNF